MNPRAVCARAPIKEMRTHKVCGISASTDRARTRQAYTVTLIDTGGAQPVDVRLRLALKLLGRACGLRCISIDQVAASTTLTPHTAQRGASGLAGGVDALPEPETCGSDDDERGVITIHTLGGPQEMLTVTRRDRHLVRVAATGTGDIYAAPHKLRGATPSPGEAAVPAKNLKTPISLVLTGV